MEYRPGMVLMPPAEKGSGRLKPKRIIAVDEQRGLLWVSVNNPHTRVANALPIESFERWTELKGIDL